MPQKRKHPPGKPVWVKKTKTAKGHWRAKPVKMNKTDKDRIYDLKVSIDNRLPMLKEYAKDEWLQDAEGELDHKLSKKAAKIRNIQKKYKMPKAIQYKNKHLNYIEDYE